MKSRQTRVVTWHAKLKLSRRYHDVAVRTRDVPNPGHLRRSGAGEWLRESDAAADAPLVQLEPGGKLEYRFTVVRGNGDDHARFCPTEVVPYACVVDGTVDVSVEPTGQRTSREIFEDAIDILKQDLRDAMVSLTKARLRDVSCVRS